MKLSDVLGKYSKEVIIEWLCNRQCLFPRKEYERDLELTRLEIEMKKSTDRMEALEVRMRGVHGEKYLDLSRQWDREQAKWDRLYAELKRLIP